MIRTLFTVLSLLCALCAVPARAHAQDAPWEAIQGQLAGLQNTVGQMQSAMGDLQKTIEAQNKVIEDQNLRIQSLETGGRTARISGAGAGASKAGRLDVRGLSQGLNPDIGVVGTVQAKLTEETEDGEGNDTIALKELEFSFAQYVDPYSRLDAILTFNDAIEDQNVEIEEAYYTHWGLPAGFIAQIGKFRPKAGKQNVLHLHQLETVDYALVVQDFFGEEGFAASGARLQNLIPNPWDVPLEITAEVLRGNEGTSFSGVSRRPIFNTHLKSFFELNDDVVLEAGATAMFGDENIGMADKGEDRYGVHVYGADATLLWRLENQKTVKFQNELFYQDRSNLVTPNENPWGFYNLLDYRFSPRWSAGVRFDYLEPREVAEGHTRTTAVSPYLTFWQSEFASFRLQYQHTDQADPELESDDAVYLQANFLIGAHRHPVQ